LAGEIFKGMDPMKKYQLVFVFVFLLTATGSIFSQDKNRENSFLKNTIVIDPLWAFSSLVANAQTGTSGITTAIQYERQLSNTTSVVGRFEYDGKGFSENGDDIFQTTYSIESHARYFPGRKNTFFLDGMLGYALFNYQVEAKNSISHFFILGGKFGWRNDFGKPGGLIVEPSFGYYWTIGDFNKETRERIIPEYDFFANLFLTTPNSFYKDLFIGGLQLSIMVGYRF
jgi:hypothetical protein